MRFARRPARPPAEPPPRTGDDARDVFLVKHLRRPFARARTRSERTRSRRVGLGDARRSVPGLEHPAQERTAGDVAARSAGPGAASSASAAAEGAARQALGRERPGARRRGGARPARRPAPSAMAPSTAAGTRASPRRAARETRRAPAARGRRRSTPAAATSAPSSSAGMAARPTRVPREGLWNMFSVSAIDTENRNPPARRSAAGRPGGRRRRRHGPENRSAHRTRDGEENPGPGPVKHQDGVHRDTRHWPPSSRRRPEPRGAPEHLRPPRRRSRRAEGALRRVRCRGKGETPKGPAPSRGGRRRAVRVKTPPRATPSTRRRRLRHAMPD